MLRLMATSACTNFSRHLSGCHVARAVAARWSSSSLGSQRGKEHVIVALGGNALLKRGEPMTVANQRKNVSAAVSSLLPVLKNHTVTFVHGNGPQVGLLALEDAAYQAQSGIEQSDLNLDVLDAETEGLIGYLIEQELSAKLGQDFAMATVLSQIIVDPEDPAFQNPTKFIGPVYSEDEAEKLGMPVKRDGDYFRRVVPSPVPVRLIRQQMRAIRLLTDSDCIVICAGGGGIPVVEDRENKRLKGVDAVIDKDRAAAMLGITLASSGLMILTDIPAVAVGYGTPRERWIKSASPEQLNALMNEFPDGSMGPKVESAIAFVHASGGGGGGGWCTIGSLLEADKMMRREAGTLVTTDYGPDHIKYYESELVTT